MKFSKIKFHGNLPSGSRADTCLQTDGVSDTTKVISAFRDYTKAPKRFADQPKYNGVQFTTSS